jgi:alpha-1,3-rhamnosyltransferase
MMDFSKNKPEIFAFVPSYNHAPFVEKCLKSIIKQTLPPKKLLVIDDGSKDDSAKTIERVLRDCSFEAELIVRENRGLCATLNEGFSHCGAEFFAYISSDDVWLPEFLESRAGILQKRPDAVLAYGYSYLIDAQDKIIDSTENWGEYADGNALSMLLYPIIPASASVVYRRKALEKCAWNEDSILEDYELYLLLSVLGEFALDEKILSAWRIHDANTSADFPLMMSEWLSAQLRVADEIGLSREELEKTQKKLKFRCVADFIRHGYRKDAFKLFWENQDCADSLTALGKMFLRFFVPTNFFQRRKTVEEKTILTY